MKRLLCIMALLSLFPVVNWAQQGKPSQSPQTWKGVVVDSNGEAIPGVAVFVSGAVSGGSITGNDGSYSIVAKPDDEINFACLGYETLILKASSAAGAFTPNRRTMTKPSRIWTPPYAWIPPAPWHCSTAP